MKPWSRLFLAREGLLTVQFTQSQPHLTFDPTRPNSLTQLRCPAERRRGSDAEENSRMWHDKPPWRRESFTDRSRARTHWWGPTEPRTPSYPRSV